jgi:hypothetical protein
VKRSTQLLSLAALLLSCAAASAQERLQFPSLGDNGAGPPATMLDGYVFQLAGGRGAPR